MWNVAIGVRQQETKDCRDSQAQRTSDGSSGADLQEAGLPAEWYM